jgi:hypothetical protein
MKKKLIIPVLILAMMLVFMGTALASSDDGVAHYYWSGWFNQVQQGNQNMFVYVVQRVIQQNYESTQGYTGYFGSETKTNVKNYQKSHGLSHDGIVGSATYSYLQGELRDSDGDHMHTVYGGDGNEYFWHGQYSGTWNISHKGDNGWYTIK